MADARSASVLCELAVVGPCPNKVAIVEDRFLISAAKPFDPFVLGRADVGLKQAPRFSLGRYSADRFGGELIAQIRRSGDLVSFDTTVGWALKLRGLPRGGNWRSPLVR